MKPPAILILGETSIPVARQVQMALPEAVVYGLIKRTQSADFTYTNFGETVREFFQTGTPIIGICAAGILIRTLAPLLTNKWQEPPVLAIAEDGSAVVPLLGGLQGVNDLARQIASVWQISPAITTTGDIRFKTTLLSPPPGYQLVNPDDAKKFLSDLLAGEKVKLIGEADWLKNSNLPISSAAKLSIEIIDKNNLNLAKPSTDCLVYLYEESQQIKEVNLPFLSFVDSDKARVGEWVLAVGNPFNLNSTVTAGIISAKGRNIGILNSENRNNEFGSTAIESFIQTDAAINPGNSGGALVDLNGGLLGINTAIASPTGAYSGYGFAVPSDIVKKIVEDLIEYGVVQRGWLGVSIVSVNNDVAKEYELTVLEGAYISAFAKKSSAKEAGLKEGDVVVKIDETNIKSSTSLIEYIGRKRPGDKVNVTVNRKGKEVTYTVLLNARDGKSSVVKAEEVGGYASLGLEVEDIEAKLLKKLEIAQGVRISKLGNGRLARDTDIREGFIITHVNDVPVKSVKEFNEIMKKKKSGELVTLSGVYEDFPREFIYAIRL